MNTAEHLKHTNIPERMHHAIIGYVENHRLPKVGEDVIVNPERADNNLVQHEFVGTVVSIDKPRLYVVRDQEDNVYTVLLSSLSRSD